MNTLRQHRKARHLDQHELASIIGISQSRICHIEIYNDLPSLSHARILAAYFGVKVGAMFPDGLEPRKFGRHVEPYLPPVPVLPPRPLAPRCWKCGSARISIAETCYQCGAEFWKAEEAMRP